MKRTLTGKKDFFEEYISTSSLLPPTSFPVVYSTFDVEAIFVWVVECISPFRAHRIS
jgi:hypothetical protein